MIEDSGHIIVDFDRSALGVLEGRKTLSNAKRSAVAKKSSALNICHLNQAPNDIFRHRPSSFIISRYQWALGHYMA